MEPPDDNIQKNELIPSEALPVVPAQESGQQKEISLFSKILFLFVVSSIEFLFLWGLDEGVIPFRGGEGSWGLAYVFAALFAVPGVLLGASPLSWRWKLFGLFGSYVLKVIAPFGFGYLYLSSPLLFLQTLLLRPVVFGIASGIVIFFFLRKIEHRLLSFRLVRIFFLVLFLLIAGIEIILLFKIGSGIAVSHGNLEQGLGYCNKKGSASCYQDLQKKYNFSPETCEGTGGFGEDYCYDAVAINTNNIALCKNPPGENPSCTMQIMKQMSESNLAQFVNNPPDCEIFTRDPRVRDQSTRNDCYADYAYYLPATTEKEISYRISVCEKTEFTIKSLCIVITAEKAISILPKSEYLQLCAKISKFDANGYWRKDCFGENEDTFGEPEAKESLSIPVKREQEHTAKNCTDSDGGQDYFAKGTIMGVERRIENPGTENQKTVDGGEATKTDQCTKTFGSTEANQSSVLEYYCGPDGRITGQSYVCQNGCTDGACKR